MSSISAQELIEIVLSQQKIISKLKNYDIDSYLNIMKKYDIGCNIKISTYDDYLREIKPMILRFKPHLSESQYNILLFFRAQMDLLILDVFKQMI